MILLKLLEVLAELKAGRRDDEPYLATANFYRYVGQKTWNFYR